MAGASHSLTASMASGAGAPTKENLENALEEIANDLDPVSKRDVAELIAKVGQADYNKFWKPLAPGKTIEEFGQGSGVSDR